MLCPRYGEVLFLWSRSDCEVRCTDMAAARAGIPVTLTIDESRRSGS